MPSLPRSLALVVVLAACRPTRGGAPDPAARSDARIAGVALVVNNLELRYAQLAATRATNAEVRTYATRLRTDHASLNATLTDLLAQLGLAAQDDQVGLALRDTSLARRARLGERGAREFDAAYMALEVESHRELLGVLDALQADAAARPALREYVAALRPAILAHLAHAEQVRASLARRR